GAGPLTAERQFSADQSQSNVGRLVLTTGSGASIDLVQQNVLQSGRLAALVQLRDTILPGAQNQLDEIAAGLAQALAPVTTHGTPTPPGPQSGFTLDLASIRDGNDFSLSYTSGGIDRTVKMVNVADASKLPLDYLDANGTRVMGMDFAAGGPAIATRLSQAIG